MPHQQHNNRGQREHERNHPADMLGRLLWIQIHGHRGGHPRDGDSNGIPGADTLEQDDGRIHRRTILHVVKLARARVCRNQPVSYVGSRAISNWIAELRQ
jgi:hypothetical protein